MKTFRQFQEDTSSTEEKQNLYKEKLKIRRQNALERSKAIPKNFSAKMRQKEDDARERTARMRAEIAAREKENQIKNHK